MIEEYTLDLQVDFESAFISGNVGIRAEGLGQDSLELDAKELEIRSVRVGSQSVPFEHDKEKDRLTIRGIPEGFCEVLINIEYQKQISDSASTGVYKCQNDSDYFIITDFEPDRARTFFPCKDHPSWKAIFNVRVTTAKELKVISNTPIKSVEALDDRRSRFVFEPTPKMSTYLLFVGIGRFAETSSSPDEEGAKIVVASRREVSDKCEFTLGIARRALEESEDYYGVQYPLPKLHIICLTEYSGAMENWGAITASEIVSILDEKKSTLFDKQRAALVTIHEIEHQWFGDLVTMKWWNDIWLNESFATFMSHKILDRIHPEWELWSFFVTRYGFDAKKVDGLITTHPVEMKLRSPSEMNEAFDYISYDKGASVLRMIEEFIGNEEFRQGITKYIRAFSYSNASSEDLWNSLEQSSAQPVSKIMEPWLRLPGFPLVSVRVSEGKLIFVQKRFLLSGDEEGNTPPPNESLWPIPVIMEMNGTTSRFLLSERTREVAIPENGLKSIIVNLSQSGFYCVEYDSLLYSILEKRFDSLSSLDKSGLLNDLSQLFIAGRIDPELFYKFVALCFQEKHYSIVYSLWRELELYIGIAENSPRLREVNARFLKSQMERLGLEARDGENPNDRTLREFVSYQLAKVDDDFAKEMAKRFKKYDSLDPELKSAAAVGYARTEGIKAYDDLIGRVKKTANEVDREKFYMGLGSFDDPQLVQRFLDFSDGGVPRSDIFWKLYYSSRNPSARQIVWDWIRANFDRLWDLLGSTLFVMNLLDVVVPRCAVEDEEGARSFFLSPERLEKGEMSFRRQLELLHVYASLRKRLADEGS